MLVRPQWQPLDVCHEVRVTQLKDREALDGLVHDVAVRKIADRDHLMFPGHLEDVLDRSGFYRSESGLRLFPHSVELFCWTSLKASPVALGAEIAWCALVFVADS